MTTQLTNNDLDRFQKFIENRLRVKLSDHKLPSSWRHTKEGERNHKIYVKDARALLGRIKAEINDNNSQQFP